MNFLKYFVLLLYLGLGNYPRFGYQTSFSKEYLKIQKAN